MNRFAKIKNAGTRRKLDVTAICRCCGMQDDHKTPILGQLTEDEVEFHEKVSTLTGINVVRADKMPQSMCETCMDKINDFYEFRLMAQNTEKQTREALGLPLVEVPQISPARLISTRESIVRLVDYKQSPEESLLVEQQLGRPLMSEVIPSTSKKRAVKPIAVVQPPTKRSRKDVSCRICADTYFSYQSDLNDHLMKVHLPLVAKYACGSCRETFDQLSDFKSHESMHSRDKLPYTCFNCTLSFTKLRDFARHMTNYNCDEKEKLELLVTDIKCFQCKKKFLTQNLFEWHGCFLKTRGNCSKCGKYFSIKKMLFKHYVLCSGRFKAPEAARNPATLVKAESSTSEAVKVSKSATTGPKRKTVPNRKMSTMPNIVKAELNLDDHLNPPEEDDEYENYNEDITYDNFNNDSDIDDAFTPPDVVLGLEDEPGVRVKQERLSDPPIVQQKPGSSQISPQLVRNIKKEKSSHPSTIVTTNANSSKPSTQQQNNMWKLKIKSEQRSGSAPATSKVLNPFAVGARKTSNELNSGQKNVFKISNELMMKIKLEKKDIGYGVDVVKERDEAEAEDEDLMQDEPMAVVKIKQEKFDAAYGEERDATKSKRRLINPMALMMRDKPLSNGTSENSLVISAVSSINPITTTENGKNSLTGHLAECFEKKPQETSLINDVPTQETTTTTTRATMVQIPREFMENQENHSSPSSTVELTEEDKVNEKQKQYGDTADVDDDDLDALMKQYEDTAPPVDTAADNSDIFQDLLKFD